MVFTWAEKLVLENVSSCVDGDWRCFTVTIKEPTVKYLVRKNLIFIHRGNPGCAHTE